MPPDDDDGSSAKLACTNAKTPNEDFRLVVTVITVEASIVSSKCFFRRRQLRRIHRSLDDETACRLSPHIYYQSCRLLQLPAAGQLKSITEKLQQVVKAAARLTTNTRNFDGGLAHMQRRLLHGLVR